MISHSIDFYEEQFKNQIMQTLFGSNDCCLKAYTLQLINTYSHDYQNINDAYLKVKREIVG
jgi:hypothetical protein